MEKGWNVEEAGQNEGRKKRSVPAMPLISYSHFQASVCLPGFMWTCIIHRDLYSYGRDP